MILMSKWFEILKEDWRERLKRIEEANKKTRRGVKRGMHTERGSRRRSEMRGGGKSATGKKVTCDMCGKLMHVRSAREGSLDTGLNYCKQCAKARGI